MRLVLGALSLALLSAGANPADAARAARPPWLMAQAEPSAPAQAAPTPPSASPAQAPQQPAPAPTPGTAAAPASPKPEPQARPQPQPQPQPQEERAVQPQQGTNLPTPPTGANSPTSGSFVASKQGGQWLASELNGRDVYDTHGNRIGSVSDLLVDQSGRLSAVVIGVGGFLGIGTKDVAVPYQDLKTGNRDAKPILVLNHTRDELKNAPAFAASKANP